MNILSNLEEIANLIIRPSRYCYKITDLGNKTFKIDQKKVTRHDFDIKNSRNLKIKCSLYSTKQLKQIEHLLIYLHCNSGSRVQGIAYLKLAIQHDFSYLVFDFTGSGMSQGKYVSLGFYQTQDLQCVYQYIKQIISQKAKIILWGRSMGAVTAINFLLKRRYQVFMAIFDSPFRSLKQLFLQIGRQKTSFPDFLLQMAYNYLKPIILQKAGFDIQQVDLKLQGNTTNNSAIFIASKQDSLVPFSQIDELFNLYKGQKQMLLIEEGHNQARNTKFIESIFKSIKKQISQNQINTRIRLQRQIQKQNFYSHHLTQKQKSQKLQKKQVSKKKLQLTIKSLSQKQLFTNSIVGRTLRQDQTKLTYDKMNMRRNIQQKQLQHTYNQYGLKQEESVTINIHKYQRKVVQQQANINIQNLTLAPVLQKKQISCLLPHKKSFKLLSIAQEQTNLAINAIPTENQKKLLHNNKSQSKLRVKNKPFHIKNFFGNQNLNNSSLKQVGHIKATKLQTNETNPLNQKDENSLKIKVRQQNITFSIKNKSQVYFPTQNTIRFNKDKSQFYQLQIPYSAERKDISSPNIKLIQQQALLLNNCQTENKLKKKKFNLRSQSSDKKGRIIDRIHKQIHSEEAIDVQVHQPHSDIKKQTIHTNPINSQTRCIKQKDFLRRCQSLQKVFKIQQNKSAINFITKNIKTNNTNTSNNTKIPQNRTQQNPNNKPIININIQPYVHQFNQNESSINATHSYRQIKCTQRVLQKIISKQQKQKYKKMISINNINGVENQSSSSMGAENDISLKKNQEQKEKLLKQKQNGGVKMKYRKTLQHIVNKKPPYVQLKGIKNYRNSLQSKYKTEIRK